MDGVRWNALKQAAKYVVFLNVVGGLVLVTIGLWLGLALWLAVTQHVAFSVVYVMASVSLLIGFIDYKDRLSKQWIWK